MKFSTCLLALLAFSIAAPSASAQTRLDLGAGVDASVGTGIRANATASATATATTTEQERTGLLKNQFGMEIRSAAEVTTEEDLDAFEENLLVADSSIADADSSQKGVGISYWHEGRFLVFIPVKIQSRTEARAGESNEVVIKTEMPWWSFLVSGLAGVQKKVQEELTANDQFSADVLASSDAHARARALEAIASAHANASAK